MNNGKEKTRKSLVKFGFTIVEMIVAVAIFSIVMVLSVGALLSVIAVNKQAQSMKSIVNNLNYALEYMMRDIRTGTNYDCDPTSPALDNCLVGDNPGNSITFIDQKGFKVIYSYSIQDQKIMREIQNNKSDLTAPEVLIDRLNFYVDNIGQPKVIILIGGKMLLKNDRPVRFDVETMATQRLFNK